MTKFYEEYIDLILMKLNYLKKEPKGELTIVISEKKK
jgi:hypothetical protein